MPRLLPILSSVVAVVLVASASAQLPSESFRLGPALARIPAPEGFAPVSPQFPRLFERFAKTEPTESTLIQVFVDDSVVSDLLRNEDVELNFYAKVSTPKRQSDITEKQFAAHVGELEAQLVGFFDSKNPLLSDVTQKIRKGLSEHNGAVSTFEIRFSNDIGVVDRQPTVFSHMVLLNVEGPQGTIPLLATSSMLLIKKRVVFVQAYRRITEAMDAEVLRDFAKKWNAEILHANSDTAVGAR